VVGKQVMFETYPFHSTKSRNGGKEDIKAEHADVIGQLLLRAGRLLVNEQTRKWV
jgi:hypothetical protein